MADDVLVQDYNEGKNAFRVGIKTLNIKKAKAAKGDNSKVVLVAAHHLCREIRREIHKVGGRIDSSKSKRNFILIGPDNAAAIAAEADAVMDAHGINRAKLREDAIMAIEVISSLPRGSAIPLQEYAEASIAFFNARFAAPAKAIFAIAHVDEGAPHVYMLFVPLVNGGSGLGGDAVRKMAGTQDEIDEAFYQEVGKRYGLEKPIRKVRLPYVERVRLAGLLMERFLARVPELRGNASACNDLWKKLVDDPWTLALAFGLEPSKTDQTVPDYGGVAPEKCTNPMTMFRVGAGTEPENEAGANLDAPRRTAGGCPGQRGADPVRGHRLPHPPGLCSRCCWRIGSCTDPATHQDRHCHRSGSRHARRPTARARDPRPRRRVGYGTVGWRFRRVHHVAAEAGIGLSPRGSRRDRRN